MIKGLPVYNIFVDEEQELEVDKVSIVNSPAVESFFLKFKEDSTKSKLSLSTDEKKELMGVALIPDVPIYRNVDGEEFYVIFNRDTIKNIAMNLFKKGYNTRMNVEHTEEDADSFIYQSYIVDRALGLNPPVGLEDTPDGSWIIGVKVNSEELWKDIKSGNRNGFSVEGLFGLEKIDSQLKFNSEVENNKGYTTLEDLKEFEIASKNFIDLLEKVAKQPLYTLTTYK